MEKIIALIVSAGLASRMNIDQNKAFLEVSGESIIRRTMKTFLTNQNVNEIYVVVNANELKLMEEHLSDLNQQENTKIHIIIGGKTRQDSVRLGLAGVIKRYPELNIKAKENTLDSLLEELANQHENGRERTLCLVHDGARCLVSQELINSCIDILRENYQGVVAALPVTDTIHVINSKNEIIKTPKRDTLYSAQTPQGADFEVLLMAHKYAKQKSIKVTDDISVLREISYPVKISQGDVNNIKITHPKDIDIAEKLIKNP